MTGLQADVNNLPPGNINNTIPCIAYNMTKQKDLVYIQVDPSNSYFQYAYVGSPLTLNPIDGIPPISLSICPCFLDCTLVDLTAS